MHNKDDDEDGDREAVKSPAKELGFDTEASGSQNMLRALH